MSTEVRHQANVLAIHAIPRIQLEALAAAETALARALESQPREVCPEVVDAVRALLAQDHLTIAQRTALVQGLCSRLGALLEPAAARPQLFAVGEDA